VSLRRVLGYCFPVVALAFLVASGNAWSEPTRLTASDGSLCTIVGTAGSDSISGTKGPDVICGLGGNDVINGLSGNDIIDAGAGNDTIAGGAGDDKIDPGSGSDIVGGNAGTNTLYFGADSAPVTVDLSKLTVAPELKHRLDNIRTGVAVDTHGWMERV